MTIIVGWLDDDRPCVAADTRCSHGALFQTDLDPKVFRVGTFRGGPVFAGFAGDSCVCDAGVDALQLGDVEGTHGDLQSAIRARAAFDAHDDCEGLVVAYGAIYFLPGDGSVLQVNGVLAAIGSGAEFAHGFLAGCQMDERAPQEAAVCAAINATFAVPVLGCGGTITVLRG